MGEWVSREYLARHIGDGEARSTLVPARCALFGYALDEMKLDGQYRPSDLPAPRDAVEARHRGLRRRREDPHRLLQGAGHAVSSRDDLDPLGRQIIECCLHDGTLDDYLALTPMKLK